MSGYIEETDAAEMDRLEEALGRRWAQARGRPYPIPPATLGPGAQPPNPEQFYQRYYRRFHRYQGGAVLVVDSNMDGWDGDQVQLADRSRVTLDIVVRTRTRAQLTQASRDRLDADGVPDREPPVREVARGR